MEHKEEPEEYNSPIEEVRLTVPATDDPTLPVITFRTWVLGPITCVFLAMFKQFMSYRQNEISIPDSCFSILILPVGKLMAASLPTKPIRIPIINRKFSMNPGPFNIKEHFVLTILAKSGLSYPLELLIVVIVKAFYHKNINFWASFLLIQTSQMAGYGFAGLFTKFLVESPYMWWPSCLPDVSLYRALHEKKVEVRTKGRLRGLQFFIIVLVSSFAYHIIPGYFFPSISALSFMCWIWKDSITAQQIGSGLHGLGIGSFSLDWNTISGFLGSPIIFPMFSILNSMAGFILLAYILVPIAYWTNSYSAKRFAFFSNDLFDVNGQPYNISRILNEDFTLNEQAYNDYSIIYLSIFFVFSIGLNLASETATITHFILYHARESWNIFKQAWKGRNQFNDVHSRLMKSYEPIPQWWFYIIIFPTIALALLNSIYFGKEFQLPYWGVLLGYMLPLISILPIGVISGTTGQGGLDMFGLSQLIFGSIYPGYPLANMAFKYYSTCTLNTALSIIPEFKLGHYLKIPPKSLFIAQIVGSFISYSTGLGTVWWLLSSVENMCDKKKLPEGSPWTCPAVHTLYSKSIIWGGVGPRRMFASQGPYSNMYYFFLIGVIATGIVWILSRMLPEKKWIRLTNVPLILSSAAMMLPVNSVNYWSWLIVGIIYNLVVYRKHKEWWAKYNYHLSNGLAIGSAFLALVTSVTVNLKDVYGLEWWGLSMDDHCPLATCPTAPGVKVDGCPVLQ